MIGPQNSYTDTVQSLSAGGGSREERTEWRLLDICVTHFVLADRQTDSGSQGQTTPRAPPMLGSTLNLNRELLYGIFFSQFRQQSEYPVSIC